MSVLGSTLAGWTIEFLLGAAERGVLCPVAGAGLSCDLDAPTWKELLESVGKKLEQRGQQLPAPADDLAQGVELGIVFDLINEAGNLGCLCEIFDEKVPESWTVEGLEVRGAHLPFEQTAPCLLAKLCILNALQAGPRSYHAVTYNFDTYLEEAVSALGYPAVAVAPGGEQRWASRRARQYPGYRSRRSGLEIRIAHPHGLAPRPSENSWGTRRRRVFDHRDLVLTASSYHARATRPLAAPALWQLLSFGSRHCLFYGFSFADQAVRMLLWTAAQERPGMLPETRHVAVFRKLEVAGAHPADGWEPQWGRYLARLGVLRLGTPDFLQQKRYLRLLVREAERRRLGAGP